MEQHLSVSEHIGTQLSKIRDRLTSFNCTCVSFSSQESPRVRELSRKSEGFENVSYGGSTFRSTSWLSSESLTEKEQLEVHWMIMREGQGRKKWATRTLEVKTNEFWTSARRKDFVSNVLVGFDQEFRSGRRSFPLVLGYHKGGFLPNSPRKFNTRPESPLGPDDYVLEDFDDELDWELPSDENNDKLEKKREKKVNKSKGVWKRIKGFFARHFDFKVSFD